MAGNFSLNTGGIAGLSQVLSVNYDGNLVDFLVEGNRYTLLAGSALSLTTLQQTGVDTATYNVTIVNPGTANAVLGVVTGGTTARTITVNLATNGSSVITSTWAQVATAINGHATAGTWVVATGTGATATAVGTTGFAVKYVESDLRKLAEIRSWSANGVPVFTEF